jgi:hypothetical protein
MDRDIRRYIRAKTKVVALLNEQKQAIIHRAVTRGIDPDVRLRPSGVEWLGDVPASWLVERTKNLFRLRTQKSGERHGLELLSVYTHIGIRYRLLPTRWLGSAIATACAAMGWNRPGPFRPPSKRVLCRP